MKMISGSTRRRKAEAEREGKESRKRMKHSEEGSGEDPLSQKITIGHKWELSGNVFCRA